MVLLWGLFGCSALSTYRSSLFVDPPTPPAAMGAPIQGFTVGGYATGRVLGATDPYGGLGDPGVMVPEASLGGQVRLGFPWVELGAHVDYADYAWSHANAVGVLPIESGAPMLGLGTHLTVGHMWNAVGFGFTLDATRLSLPYARYSYHGPDALEDGAWLGDADQFYVLDAEGSAHPLRIRGTFAVTASAGRVDLSPGLSVCPTFTNQGFANEPTPVYEAGPLGLIPAMDVGVWIDQLRIGGQVWGAIGAHAASGGIDSGLGGRLMVDWAPGRHTPTPGSHAPASGEVALSQR